MQIDVHVPNQQKFYKLNSTEDKEPQNIHSMEAHTNDSEVDWNTGICGCISCERPSVCCMACICPCLLFGEIHHAVQYRDIAENKTNSNARCNAAACEFCLLDYHISAVILLCFAYFTACWVPIPSLTCLTHNITRREIRNQNEQGLLKGSCLSDVLLTFCCTCCVLVQEHTQVFPHSA